MDFKQTKTENVKSIVESMQGCDLYLNLLELMICSKTWPSVVQSVVG